MRKRLVLEVLLLEVRLLSIEDDPRMIRKALDNQAVHGEFRRVYSNPSKLHSNHRLSALLISIARCGLEIRRWRRSRRRGVGDGRSY